MVEVVWEFYVVFGMDLDLDEEEVEGVGVNVDNFVDFDFDLEREDFGWLLLDLGKYCECYCWWVVVGVNGLWKCEEFFDLVDQERLVMVIKCEGWFSQFVYNQVMWFGVFLGWVVILFFLIFFFILRFVERIDGVDKELGFRGFLLEEIFYRKFLFD